ncbi:ferritin family protein [Peribacillus sp. SCS-155]|uniref:ferritin family protein n=1 Tax=Peribacillus sedimenti TaxID=3115297 RepID=UPI0039058A38
MSSYYDYYPNIYRQSNQFIRNLERAINGEYSVINCYEKLARMATNQAERNQIQEIRQDEIRHFQQFSQLYTNLAGRQPQPQITEQCPNSYRPGLEFAFRDEQETVDFYLDMAESAETQGIKEMFRRAAADEQNHAVWFLSFMTRLR